MGLKFLGSAPLGVGFGFAVADEAPHFGAVHRAQFLGFGRFLLKAFARDFSEIMDALAEVTTKLGKRGLRPMTLLIARSAREIDAITRSPGALTLVREDYPMLQALGPPVTMDDLAAFESRSLERFRELFYESAEILRTPFGRFYSGILRAIAKSDSGQRRATAIHGRCLVQNAGRQSPRSWADPASSQVRCHRHTVNPELASEILDRGTTQECFDQSVDFGMRKSDLGLCRAIRMLGTWTTSVAPVLTAGSVGNLEGRVGQQSHQLHQFNDSPQGEFLNWWALSAWFTDLTAMLAKVGAFGR